VELRRVQCFSFGGAIFLLSSLARRLRMPNPLVDLPYLRQWNTQLLGLALIFFRFCLLATIILIPQSPSIHGFEASQIAAAIFWTAAPQLPVIFGYFAAGPRVKLESTVATEVANMKETHRRAPESGRATNASSHGYTKPRNRLEIKPCESFLQIRHSCQPRHDLGEVAGVTGKPVKRRKRGFEVGVEKIVFLRCGTREADQPVEHARSREDDTVEQGAMFEDELLCRKRSHAVTQK
jgi:hypothetical protein